MIPLYSLPSRQFNNQTHQIGPELLSDHVDPATCGGILIRWEAESINNGASIIITYRLQNGASFLIGETVTYAVPGRYELGIWHNDVDGTGTIELIVQFVGRSRVNAVVYSIAKGEDVLEWQ